METERGEGEGMPIEAERGDRSPSNRAGRRRTFGFGLSLLVVESIVVMDAGELGIGASASLSLGFRDRLVGAGCAAGIPAPETNIWFSSPGATICFPTATAAGRGGGGCIISSPRSTYEDMLVLGLPVLPNDVGGEVERTDESFVCDMDGREGLPVVKRWAWWEWEWDMSLLDWWIVFGREDCWEDV